MGTFKHNITLIAPSGNRRKTVEAIVDTGATFSAFPAPVLEELGVARERPIRLRLANGRIESRSLGTVRAELNGIQSTILCIFGEPDAPAVIGAHTLEAFLLAVDPVKKELVPVEGLWV